ncbi:pectinesterase family protein [Penicillium citrinum]|uniref:Pectinesterase family protein n=1 Tax=Penicillium citrinum TaxID=5077 RepID=A0A9W9N8H7_PENCI|nr:pectinesterase family protein [Penicillium citrinum]KAJ5215152.1 pectinesterase family protein [Penicillium citrinum]
MHNPTIPKATVSVTETTTSTEIATSAPSAASAAAITVATDSAGALTQIGDAASYAQTHDIPTVTVLAGTYSAVTISATAPITVVAESKNENDCSQNEDSALSISASAGIDFKNINFVNTGSGSAARIAGTKNGFYSCQFLSPNGGALVANQGIAIIANSFMKASDTTVEGTATFYIFNTPIMLLGESMQHISWFITATNTKSEAQVPSSATTRATEAITSTVTVDGSTKTTTNIVTVTVNTTTTILPSTTTIAETKKPKFAVTLPGLTSASIVTSTQTAAFMTITSVPTSTQTRTLESIQP